MECPNNQVILHGKYVTLRPIKLTDEEELVKAAADGELHKLWYTSVPTKSAMKNYIESALEQVSADRSIVFVVICKRTGELIGSTRFCNMDTINSRLEIGYTWYRKSSQRTSVNTETKLLLLQYAFEVLNVIAVEFRTHWMNHASRAAILRLGAKQDGVLRNHQKLPDGSLRDTVVFSIIESEWLSVKQNLIFKLSSYQID